MLLVLVFSCFFSLSASSLANNTCTERVIRSKLEYYNATVQIEDCCDRWCNVMCQFNVTQVFNTTVYYQDTECCDGYGGPTCSAICTDPCNANQECSSPDQCTCIQGWHGTNCYQVDDFTHSNVTTLSASLSWLLPMNNNNNGYLLLCNTTSPSFNMSIPKGSNTTIVNGFIPFTQYKCCIIPVLKLGIGTETCVSFLTAESVPSESPNFTVETVSPSSLLIKWQPPVSSNGIITNYTIYIDYNNGTTATKHIDRQFNLYLLQWLSKGQSVKIKLSASTSVGDGPQSDYITGTTSSTNSPPEINIPLNASLLTLSNTLSDNLQVMWSPPASTDIPSAKYYHIELIQDTSDITIIHTWTLHPNQHLNETVVLEPFVPYTVNATIFTTDNHIGQVSSNTFFLKQGVPSVAPTISRASRTSPASASVTWDDLPLYQTRGFLTNYTITLSKSTSNNTCANILAGDMIAIHTNKTSLVVNNLSIQSAYCVTISASTEAGDGRPSTKTIIPIYKSKQLCVKLQGVYDCNKWRVEQSSGKTSNLTISLVNALNEECPSCNVTTDQFLPSTRELSCVTDHKDELIYTAQIIKDNFNGLSTILEAWTSPAVNKKISVASISLLIMSGCIDGCDCSQDEQSSLGVMESQLTIIILGILLGVSVALQLLTCLLLVNYCHKYYNRVQKYTLSSNRSSGSGGSNPTSSVCYCASCSSGRTSNGSVHSTDMMNKYDQTSITMTVYSDV